MFADFEYDIEIDNHIVKCLIEATGYVATELYAADADGNRGRYESYVDNFDVDIYDSLGNNITEKIKKKYPEQYAAVRLYAYDTLIRML